MTSKKCSKCNEDKALSEYYMNYSRGTYTAECKQCNSDRSKHTYKTKTEKGVIKKKAIYNTILTELKGDDEWISIENSTYIINRKGDILNTDITTKPNFLIHSIREGYHRVWLKIGNNASQHNVHKLVLVAFGDGKRNETVNHIDGNKDNNHIDNLEWVSYSDNLKHAYVNDLKGNNRKVNDYSEEDITDIVNQLFNGVSYSKISNQYGCSVGYLSTLRHRKIHKKTWVNVLQNEIHKLTQDLT